MTRSPLDDQEQRTRRMNTSEARSMTEAETTEAAPGFTGQDEQGRQWCLTCERWKFRATHSCPGVPQLERRDDLA